MVLCGDRCQAGKCGDRGQDAIGVVRMQPYPFHFSGGERLSQMVLATPHPTKVMHQSSAAYRPSVSGKVASCSGCKL